MMKEAVLRRNCKGIEIGWFAHPVKVRQALVPLTQPVNDLDSVINAQIFHEVWAGYKAKWPSGLANYTWSIS